MLEAEEETRVVRRETAESAGDEPSKIFSISPTLMFVKIGYLLAVVGAFLVVAFFSIFLPLVVPTWISVMLGLLLLLLCKLVQSRGVLNKAVVNLLQSS